MTDRPHRPLAESAADLIGSLTDLGFAPELVEGAAADAADACARLDNAAWEAFAEWCDDTDHGDLPADPATVAAYLETLRSPADRDLAVGAIAGRHTAAGHPDPTPAPVEGPVR